ncbi:MAG: histidine--tRNA ligase [Bdellovibrionaceae bacterium]|nr:histidine--tRNA ligase [Pseudobdellovibrionaceae bacterium]
MALSTKPYKGTRDFFPEDMYLHRHIFQRLSEVIEGYGYQPYDGPMLEPFELYAAKSGQEIVEKQLYWFMDRGERKVAMRPEMTPTLARMVASRVMELPKPVRWYSIPNLWRYERPQRGRLREHWQLNVDILGGESLWADAEILRVAYSIIAAFEGQKNIKIFVNNRRLINSVFKDQLKLSAEDALKASKAVDARDKIGEEAYNKQLVEIGLSAEQIATMEDFFNSSLESAQSKFQCEGLDELTSLFKILENHPVSQVLEFNPKVMRGLDYYTGTVFEVFDVSPENNRAMFGGGRYDNLIGMFGNKTLSGVGFGMGDVTLKNFLETHKLLPDVASHIDVFFVTGNEDAIAKAAELAEPLIAAGIKTSLSLSTAKFNAQLKQANKLNAKLAIILGENELKENSATVKNLSTGEQNTLSMPINLDELKKMI